MTTEVKVLDKSETKMSCCLPLLQEMWLMRAVNRAHGEKKICF